MFIIPLIMWLAINKLYLSNKFSWGEAAIQLGVTSIVIFGLFALGSSTQTSDYKFVNGVVTSLEPKQENCTSGWTDYTDNFCTEYRTRSVPNGQTCTSYEGKLTCRTNYKTQYNYNYNWERRYFVGSTIQRYEISRVDNQGVNEPPRFTKVLVGDPVSGKEHYTNYIRGAANSLFSETLPPDVLPPLAYPSIRDIYNANRVIVANVQMKSDFQQAWNKEIAALNAAVRETGANIIVVVTNDDRQFPESLAQAWKAHNINDIIVTIGVQENYDVSWVDVRSWSSDSIVNVKIRDGIKSIGTLDTQLINSIIEKSVVDGFVLQSMDNFEYLADDITMPTWVFVIALLLLLIATPLTTYFFNKN